MIKKLNNEKKNEKKIIKTIITICFFFTMFLFIFSNLFNKKVTNLDELWNYNTARAIMNGLVPYKQISMITTPLLPTIVAFILKITTDELLVFRIINALLATTILYVASKLINKLTKNISFSIIFTGIITYIYFDYFYLDYNFTVLLISLIIEYLELNSYLKNKNKIEVISKERNILTNSKATKFDYYIDLIIGILAGLSICTKQTLGLFISFEVILIPIIFFSSKDNLKQCIKKVLWRIIGIAIPFAFFMISLIINSSFFDFIDYAILGIKTFNNSISYTLLFTNSDQVIVILAKMLPIFLVITITTAILLRIKHKRNTTLELLTFCSLPMLLTMYPIADSIHFLIATLQVEILLYYVIFKIGEKTYNKIPFSIKKLIITTACTFAILLISFEGIKQIAFNLSSHNYKSHINHYKYLETIDGFEEFITKLNQMRKENIAKGTEVYILDAEAVVYTIPLDTYTKNYDMFLKGNIGKAGEEGIINNIKNSSNCLYLIKKEGTRLNWQTPTKVIEYVRENLESQGTIGIFDIYYKSDR